MKALTIWQPWATLIMIGAKPWEWRGWPLPASIVGKTVVIHAGARQVRRSEIDDILDWIEEGDSGLVPALTRAELEHAQPGDFLLGAGLGTVQFRAPITATDWAKEHMAAGYDSDRLGHHQWAWPVSEIHSFAKPVPCRGFQGFWNWPYPIEGTP